MNDLSKPRPVQLHVIHDLGGGSAKWLADYLEADGERTNLVLRSFAHDTAAGTGISLHAGAAPDAPAIRLWTWSEEIAATVVAHGEYKAALDEIVREFAVDAVVVSSLIGHSLEVLDTGLATVVVNHDYFPYCPAINLYFGSVCASCDGERVGECEAGNPRFNPFEGFDAVARLEVREAFVQRILAPKVTMVVPSRSVADNLRHLDARFGQARFVTIEHGYGHPLPAAAPVDIDDAERLRVMVLGQLSVAKGVEILREAIDRITAFADVYLVGTRELGEEFRLRNHVHVVADYDIQDLPAHVAHIRPHAGLLMSIVPETFSYALSELRMLGVPVAATRLGSFAERIRHGEDGWLYEPNAAALVELIAHLDANRGELGRVRANIAGWRPRSAQEMVAEYHRALPLAPKAGSPAASALAAPPGGAQFAAQALTVASMWKELKALHRQVHLLQEARERDREGRAGLERRHAAEQETFSRRLGEAGQHIAAQREQLDARDRALLSLTHEVNAKTEHVAALLGSTSWKISAPLRWTARALRPLRTLARVARMALRRPGELGSNLRKAYAVWKSGGIPALKLTIGRRLAAPPVSGAAWKNYRHEFRSRVMPQIAARVAAMADRPLVSVLMPTFNTPEDVLRAAIASVEAQIYPEWELCIADDGSSAAHVARVLREHAARHPRIKIDLAGSNGGVSRASNRALAMATGRFVVLLDHDDLLEEQALFRVAETVVSDDPDMVYSDEIEVERDGETPRRFVYRPTFSLEYLRSHPYIVHLVGFRPQLLRDIGGFDETLRISQDYDLILRASEKARRIVHIPEILYRWRSHPQSAGHARMNEVMQTSTRIIQRHLERSGVKAQAGPGAGFNLFETRYSLEPGSRVAIVIPTHNHGDILRQCIESIRATVSRTAYDIVVVDHDSDHPDTLRYLASLGSSARVLRYSGSFNFSAINNWAVSQVEAGYSHYLFCNNDIEAIEEGWLERMLELGQQPSIGVVGAQLLYPDRKSVQHAGVLVGAYGAAEHYAKRIRFGEDFITPGYAEMLMLNHEVTAVTAACMLMRKDAFDAVKGFDETIKVGFGDVDLCLRVAESGYRVVFCPQARLVHHESYTRGTSTQDPHPLDSAIFRGKWRALLDAGDPYYHPALSLTSSNWSLIEPLPCEVVLRRRIVDIDRDASRQSLSFSGS